MAEKSGYEIRTDILRMAKELLVDEFVLLQEAWKFQIEQKQEDIGEVPTYPTLEQVLSTAEKMNGFVNKKS